MAAGITLICIFSRLISSTLFSYSYIYFYSYSMAFEALTQLKMYAIIETNRILAHVITIIKIKLNPSSSSIVFLSFLSSFELDFSPTISFSFSYLIRSSSVKNLSSSSLPKFLATITE